MALIEDQMREGAEVEREEVGYRDTSHIDIYTFSELH